MTYLKELQGTSLVNALRRNGWFDELTSHLIRIATPPYTKDDCDKEAKKYKRRVDFQKKSNGQYSKAIREGWLDEICIHMGKSEREKQYTKEEILKSARKWNNQRDWLKNEPSIFRSARGYSKLNNSQKDKEFWQECISHMNYIFKPNGYWTYERCKQIALNYSDRRFFHKEQYEVYKVINREGWGYLLDHMIWTTPNGNTRYPKDYFEDKEKARVEALKYTSITEIVENCVYAYRTIRKNGWDDELFSHMERHATNKPRQIYVYYWSDMHAYVGQSYDWKKRHSSHIKKGAVFEHIQKTGEQPMFKILTKRPVKEENTRKHENKWMKHYESLGYKLLNSAPAGSLGGKRSVWTEKNIWNIVSKCSSMTEFYEATKTGCIKACKEMGIYDAIVDKLITDTDPKYRTGGWTVQDALEEAKKYNSISAFQKFCSGGFKCLKRNNLLKVAFPKTINELKKEKYNNKQNCIDAALKCNSYDEFQKKYNSYYRAACKNGWSKEIKNLFPTIKRPYKTKYNINNLKELAKNCKNQSEFKKMYSGAYKAAKKLNLLDELFPNKNVYSSKYSIDDIKKIAKNCIHRSEFQKMYSGVYKRAKKLNLLDELFPTEYVHTPLKWNYESCKELSKKYKKVQSLRDNHLGAYFAIKRYGWIDEFYPNRFKPKPRKEYPKLTYAVCKSICKNHNSVKELFDNDRPVWQVCKDNNWLSEFFDNYTKQERWTYSKCEKIANNYNSLTEFCKKEQNVYNAINRNGWGDILERLERTIKPGGYWDYEQCKKEALKYSNKKEMGIHNESCKQIIQRNGWWELFDHMDELASLKKRYIYGFEFEDNHVYIGLSYNPEIRKEDHLRFQEGSSVKKHIEKTNSKYVFKVLTNEPVDMNVAGKLEAEFIKKYKESGWVMLNKNRGGALGGKKGYTYNQCKNKVSEFKTLLEFSKEANGYYHKILKMGWSELLNPLQRYTEYRGSKEYYLDNYPIVICMIEEGRSNREIADATNNKMNTVWMIRKKFKEWNVNQYDNKFW